MLVKWQEGDEGTRNDLDMLLACLVRVRGWMLGVAQEGGL